MFKLDIAKLDTAAKTLRKVETELEARRNITDGTVRRLAAQDFAGIAQYECLENFNLWMGAMDGLGGVTTSLALVLEKAVGRANFIMGYCDKLPGKIGASCQLTPENTGELALDDNYEHIGTSAQAIINVDIPNMNNTLEIAYGNSADVFDSGIIDALAALKASVASVETNICNLTSAFNNIARDIIMFEAIFSSTLDAIKEGRSKDLSMILDNMPTTISDTIETISNITSDTDAVASALLTRNRADVRFSMPDNIKISLAERTKRGRNIRLTGLDIKTDGLAKLYKLPEINAKASIEKNFEKLLKNKAVKSEQLRSLAAYKSLKTIGKVTGPVGFVLDIANVAFTPFPEYERNPYLPSSLKAARAEAATEVALFGTLIELATIPVMAITLPVTVPAAVTGAVTAGAAIAVGEIEGLIGEVTYKDYLDWRMESLYWDALNTTYLQDPEYYFFNNCFG